MIEDDKGSFKSSYLLLILISARERVLGDKAVM